MEKVMIHKLLLTMGIASLFLCFTGCASTSSTYGQTNPRFTNLPKINNYVRTESIDSETEVALHYQSTVTLGSILGVVTKNPPLENPQPLNEYMDTFINSEPLKGNLAYRHCENILSNGISYLNLCTFEYKNIKRGDRAFFLITFYDGKGVLIKSTINDMHATYQVAQNLYSLYDQKKIVLPPFEETFKGLDNNKIDKVVKEFDDELVTNIDKVPEKYKKMIKEWAERTYIDPESIRYRWQFPAQKLNPKKTNGKEVILLCFETNAKNRLGGYTGYQINGAMFENGELAEAGTKALSWGCMLPKGL